MKVLHLLLFFIITLLSVNLAGQTFNKRVQTNNNYGKTCAEFSGKLLIHDDTIITPTKSILYDTSANKISFMKLDNNGDFLDSNELVYISGAHTLYDGLMYSDSTFIFLTSFSNDNGYYHNLWIMIDKQLDTTYVKNFDPSMVSSYAHYMTALKKDQDSIITIGVSSEFETNGDVFIENLDSAGNRGSIYYYGGAEEDFPVKFSFTSDGGLLISGRTKTGSTDGEYDGFVYKIDNQYNLEWDYYWQNPDYDCALLVEELTNGNILACGCESLNPNLSNDDQELFSLILDGNGNFVSKKNYILPTKKKGTASLRMIKTNDGNFTILGQKKGKIVNGPDEGIRSFIMKIDENGDSLFYREYTVLQDPAGDNYLRDIENTSDGGFVMSGFLHPGALDTGNQDLWLLKTNCLGFAHNPVASATWGNLDNYTIRFKNESQFSGQTTIHFGDGNSTIQQEGDTSYILHTYAGTGPYQVMVVGEACGTYDTVYYSVNPTLLNTPENEKVIVAVYPNPTSNKLYLEHPDISQYDFQIYNLSGQVFAIPQSQQNNQKLEFDVSQLPSGQYVAVGLNGEQRLVERFSVMKK